MPEVDVLVERLDGATIAVEVTRLHPGGGEAARKREGTQETILSKALAEYNRRGLPPVEVVVFWDAWSDPTHIRQATLAQALADFVSAHVPEADEAVGFGVTDPHPLELPHGVDSIEIRRFGGISGHWHALRSMVLADVSLADIRERVATKGLRVAKYKGDYAERWLVLVVGAEGPSTWGEVPEQLQRVEFPSAFDRIFVVQNPSSAVELQCRRVV
jgi:hypothetical protein